MSDRPDREDRPADETVAMPSPAGPPPPTATQPMYTSSPPPPPRSRQALIIGLVLLLGLGGGFALAQFFGGDDDRIPDEDLVLYETASSGFPVAGAAFTQSTYDASRKECDKEAMKRFLRADPRRFEAWLDLQEITEAEFDAFVDRLQTRIVDRITHVTNHGCFAEGEGPCPFTVQSVLAPGTPVWFDPVGNRIVAKCFCSNPLKAPRCPPNCEGPTPTPTLSPTPTVTQPPQTQPPRTPPFCERFPNDPQCRPVTAPPPVVTEPPAETPEFCEQFPDDPQCQPPP
jgi:uncharacterized protein DUF6777